MLDQQRNAWRELTDEEIEMAAGGSSYGSYTLEHGRFLQAVEGLVDIIAGNATNNQGLRNEGLFDLGLSSAGAISDIRLKRDIALVGRLENGLGLYRYRYLWGEQAFVGVMAQEVAEIVPKAVVCGNDGYLRVNYAQLGLSLTTWEEWVSTVGAART